MVTEQLDATFAALADPTRRQIIAWLAEHELTVTELARPLDMTIPAVAKHVKALERAGLIEKGQRAQEKPCRLRGQPLRQAIDWIERYRASWEESFDQLAEYIEEVKKARAGKPES